MVGVGYKIAGKGTMEIIAVPSADDGSIHFDRRIFLDWDDFQPAPANMIIEFYENNVMRIFSHYRGYTPKFLQKSRDTGKSIGVGLANGISIPATEPKDMATVANMKIVEIDDLEWDINRTIAYDSELRKRAFEDAGEDDQDNKKYIQLKISSIQDEIEDVYQHLRLSFSEWLSMEGAGREIREALRDVLKRADLPLYEKRKRLDILLEDKVTRWLEPRVDDEEGDIDFLRINCLVKGEDECSGRCKWISGENVCKIHTPATISPNGVAIPVPRMLYLRLVDELIRYASKREELFQKQVPRLTIRQEAQRQGDQYIVPEGSPDWNTWWELLRTEWMASDTDSAKSFDEQYEPIPLGMPGGDERELPTALRGELGLDDPKASQIVWNPTTTPEQPFFFLKPILRNHPIVSKKDVNLSDSELSDIMKLANVEVLYLPRGTVAESKQKLHLGAKDVVIIANIDGTIGWLSQRGSYSVKVPRNAVPNALIVRV
jgi:hypothetical protein